MDDKMPVTDLQKFVHEQDERSSVGRFMFQHNWITRPTPINAAREIFEFHTVALLNSFKNSTTVNLDVKLLWEYDPTSEEDMDLVNTWNQNRTNFDPGPASGTIGFSTACKRLWVATRWWP